MHFQCKFNLKYRRTMYNRVNLNSDFIQLVVHYKNTWLHRTLTLLPTQEKNKIKV